LRKATKNVWSYISILHICLHGVCRDKFIFSFYYFLSGLSQSEGLKRTDNVTRTPQMFFAINSSASSFVWFRPTTFSHNITFTPECRLLSALRQTLHLQFVHASGAAFSSAEDASCLGKNAATWHEFLTTLHTSFWALYVISVTYPTSTEIIKLLFKYAVRGCNVTYSKVQWKHKTFITWSQSPCFCT
jgi:hypothetical protein